MVAHTGVETIGRCLPRESGKFSTLFYTPGEASRVDAGVGWLRHLCARFERDSCQFRSMTGL